METLRFRKILVFGLEWRKNERVRTGKPSSTSTGRKSLEGRKPRRVISGVIVLPDSEATVELLRWSKALELGGLSCDVSRWLLNAGAGRSGVRLLMANQRSFRTKLRGDKKIRA